MSLDIEQIRSIAERVAGSLGLEVVEVEFRGGGKSRMLRVFIDRAQAGGRGSQSAGGAPAAAQAGVTHEDCAAMSREMSIILDVEDVVPGGPYTLEVSSPGLDRKLTRAADFARFVGSRVKVMTREAVHGNRHFDGRLQRFEEGRLHLAPVAGGKRKRRAGEAADAVVEIELGNVERASLVPEI
jgi:ribosome maturation factor RimP